MIRVFFLSLSILLSVPFVVQAAGADLGFAKRDPIVFSEETLVAGDTVRLYARVSNYGDVDVAGYVTFYQGSSQIQKSQAISVRSDGADEEVYVDFVVPETAFNIRAEITDTDPEDKNSANNSTLTSLYTPIQDEDGDGVEDDADNCPSDKNASQKDNDLDGTGDACDDDDDNDGWSDDTEKDRGTDSTKADTDGDGVTDPSDYAPTDASITTKPAAIVAPEPTEKIPEPPSTTSTPSTPQTPNIPTTVESSVTPTDVAVTDAPARTELHLSPKAIFTYNQPSWNTYHFAAVNTSHVDARYAWDFGDGVTSSRASVDHTYRSFGDYTVTLTVTDTQGQISRDTTTVSVSFFNIDNPFLKLLLGVLFVLFVTSVSLFVRMYGKGKGSMNEPEDTEEEPLYDKAA